MNMNTTTTPSVTADHVAVATNPEAAASTVDRSINERGRRHGTVKIRTGDIEGAPVHPDGPGVFLVDLVLVPEGPVDLRRVLDIKANRRMCSLRCGCRSVQVRVLRHEIHVQTAPVFIVNWRPDSDSINIPRMFGKFTNMLARALTAKVAPGACLRLRLRSATVLGSKQIPGLPVYKRTEEVQELLTKHWCASPMVPSGKAVQRKIRSTGTAAA